MWKYGRTILVWFGEEKMDGGEASEVPRSAIINPHPHVPHFLFISFFSE